MKKLILALALVIGLTTFAQEYACLPTLGYTHMQYVFYF